MTLRLVLLAMLFAPSIVRAAESDAVVQGSIDKDAIRRVVKRHLLAVRRCYEQRLAQKPDLTGKVVLKWVIGSKGDVTSVEVSDSSTKDSELDRCVAAEIKTWKFPAPAGGGSVVISYPFNFANSDAGSNASSDPKAASSPPETAAPKRIVADRQHDLLLDEGRVPYRVASGPSLELAIAALELGRIAADANVVRLRLGDATYEAPLPPTASYTLDKTTLTPIKGAPAFSGFPPLTFGLVMIGRRNGDKFTELWTATLQIVK